MDPLSITTGVVGLATLAYQLIGYLGTVKAGGKDRLALLNEITTLWMAMTALQEQVSPDTLKDNKIPPTLLPLFEPDGVINEIKIQMEGLETKLKARSAHGKFAQTLTWPFTQKDVQQIIDRIYRLKSTLQDGINQSTHALTQDIYRDGQSVKKVIDEARTKELIEWISPLNFVAKQSMIWNEHHKGTCKWFLDRDDVREWREGENKVIFCPGIPGAGKTFLSSIMYNELQGLRDRGEGGLKDAAIIMLYCKWDDPLSQNIDNLLSSIIKQLVQRYEVGLTELETMYTKHSKDGTRPSKEQLQSTLTRLLREFKKVFIILDGLDELQKEQERLPLLQKLFPWGELSRVKDKDETVYSPINLMVTSRPLPNIVRHFRDVSKETIYCDRGSKGDLPLQFHCAECETQNGVSFDLCDLCYNSGKRCDYKGHSFYFQFNTRIIQISAVDEDLDTYVRWRTLNSDFLQQCVEVKEGLMDKILETVVANNGGMFLLAKFNMDSLESKLSVRQVLTALQSLPRELDDTYSDAMQRIHDLRSSQRETVMTFLRWVVFAEQPIHERAIEHALAIKDDYGDIDDDDIIRARNLANKCAGLVQFDESDCLRLVHYSAENYFKQTRERWFPNGNQPLAYACLKYLQFDLFKNGACSGPTEAVDFDRRIDKYPFLRYASLNWAKHFDSASEEEELFTRAIEFLTDPGCLATVTQALWYLEDQQRSTSWSAKDGSAIHLAAHFNLTSLIKELIRRGHNPDVKDINGVTPLGLAVRRPDADDVVTTLIEAGASVNTIDNSGHAPIHNAIMYDKLEILKLIVAQKSVDVNISHPSWYSFTPLHVAAAIGYVKHLEVLIAHKSIALNKECTSPEGATPLMLAAQRGEEETVKVLLELPGLEINHQDKDGRTALIYAAERGYYSIVEALLNKGADTEKQEKGSNGTAIMRAIDYGRNNVVELLVKCGTNLHHVDVFNRGILHSAAVNRQPDILRMLVAHDKTLDVNMRDINGKTTLHDIARMGGVETAETLIDLGGDPTIKDNHGRTPIRVAHESNHLGILEMFRAARRQRKENGIVSKSDPEVDEIKRSDTGISLPGTLPIWSVVVSNLINELKERLPTSTPDEINEIDQDMGQSALYWAAAQRSPEVVQLLLSHGADVNLQNFYGRTPLHVAMMDARWDIAEILVDAGADLELENIWGYTPLAEAKAASGLLLIERGAKLEDRNKIDLDYYLPLAVKHGYETSVRRLIAAGADVWSKGSTGKTPYMIAKENNRNELANLILQLAPKPSTPEPEPEPEPEPVKDSEKATGETNGVSEEKLSGLSGPILSIDADAKSGKSFFARHLYTLFLVLILVLATTLARVR
ncbi:ankyrin repeat-containing domain protein [Aspergillus karnatakaensis]|uniref:ankyrin repeat-containing domain protein n=1 Tax=Aspergillus karnatakaensis TaxID=1810916 RepID=UPI003CCCE314